MKRIMKRSLAIALAITVVGAGLAFMPKKANTVKAAQTWELYWSDEFNGTALDTSVWKYETGNGNWGWGNGEVEYYTSRTKNVNVSDGNLNIVALQEGYGGKAYTSGRIKTAGNKTTKYGKIEAKIKVENGNQDGVWPAFWMMGDDINSVGWPACGEIDIMEHANSNAFMSGAIHWDNGGHNWWGSGAEGARSAYGFFGDNVNNGINGWHTYGLIWDENHMEWQLDGNTFLTANITSSNADEFRKEHFFLLNLAIGGTGTGFTNNKTANDATFQTTTMMVDYLRVYKLTGEPDPTTEAPTTTTPEPTTWDPEIPTSVKIEDVNAAAEAPSVFDSYFANGSWDSGAGVISNQTKHGFSMHISNTGNNLWGVQAYLNNLPYIPGNTYTYKCTIESDIDRNIMVKVSADDDDHTINQERVSVQAGVPYYYERQITVPANFNQNMHLYFGLGHDGEDTSAKEQINNISVSNLSFTTQKKTVIRLDETTTEEPTPEQTTVVPDITTEKEETTVAPEKTTTKKSSVKPTTKKPAKKPGKVSIKKKVTRKKKSLKIKFKKIKTANGYQIRYSDNKWFDGYWEKYTKKTTYKIKKLDRRTKYFIKVRAYVMNGKNKLYGKFSKTKKASTK